MTFARVLLVLWLVSALFGLDSRSQTSPKRTLLVASCSGEVTCEQVSLHRFVFQGGSLKAKEVVHRLPPGKIYFHVFENEIFENRYLISFNGAVFDLDTKELFDKETGKYVARDGRRIYIDQIDLNGNNSSTYSFDLDSKKYARYARPNFYSLGNGPISPDGKKAATFDNVAEGFFVLTRKGDSPSDFSSFRASGKNRVSCGKKCSSPIVSSIWIDSDRFLTQRSNGELVIFDYPTREWTELLKIPLPDEMPRKPAFFSDHEGRIYYDADKLYLIDVANKRYSETDEFGLGHGFKVSGRQAVKWFSFGDQKLTSFISGNYSATDGYLAADFQDLPLTGTYPIGIRVWGSGLGTWTTIRIKFRPHIIGWLTE